MSARLIRQIAIATTVLVYFAALCLYVSYRDGRGKPREQAPSVLQRPEPVYSAEAQIAHINGTVILKATITSGGRVKNIAVTHGSGFGLDEMAVAALSHWIFTPARSDNVPVETHTSVAIPFYLDSHSPVAELQFTLGGNTSRPRLLSGQRLPYLRTIEPATFYIDEKGDPGDINSGSERLLNVIRTWKFSPAVRMNHRVAVNATLRMVALRLS